MFTISRRTMLSNDASDLPIPLSAFVPCTGSYHRFSAVSRKVVHVSVRVPALLSNDTLVNHIKVQSTSGAAVRARRISDEYRPVPPLIPDERGAHYCAPIHRAMA